MRPPRWLLLAIVALVGAAEIVAVSAASMIPAIGVRCDPAVLVDGVLRCGEDAPLILSDLCEGAPAAAIRSGDAIERAAICGVGSPLRGASGWVRMAGAELGALALPLNLNEASTDELASLPGIGPVLAERIVAGRPYASVAEVDRIKGIGPAKLAAIRTRARVGW